MSKWISVIEGLPSRPDLNEKFTQIDCLISDGNNVCMGSYEWGGCPEKWEAFGKYHDIENSKVTHWMLPPMPPKDEIQ